MQGRAQGRPRAVAAIDVGTNTTLLLLARPGERAGDEPEVLAEGAEITRLGRGIGKRVGPDGGGDGLGQDAIDRTLAVLARYAALAAQHDAEVAAIGTEALRRAPNADAFLTPAARILGAPVEVISGEREAGLTFLAVRRAFPDQVSRERVAVLDIGGGSTEIIVADQGRIAFRESLPLGSVRLHESFVSSNPPRPEDAAAVERHVAGTLVGAARAFAPPAPTLLVGVAGTVTSLAAMALGLHSYDPARVHGSWLGLDELDRQIDRLARATQAERETFVGLDPRRADVIFAGALLLRGIARRCGVTSIRVSDRGIRWGLFWERAGARATD